MLPLSRQRTRDHRHLFTCPALREEHNTLRERTDRIFKKWSIPYSALGHLPNFSTKSHWINILQKKLSKNQKSLTLSGKRCNNSSRTTGRLINLTDTKRFL